jgi:hypothetical protein
VTVTGYTEEVNIAVAGIANGHRTLLNGDLPPTPTTGKKTVEPARKWWQRAQ